MLKNYSLARLKTTKPVKSPPKTPEALKKEKLRKRSKTIAGKLAAFANDFDFHIDVNISEKATGKKYKLVAGGDAPADSEATDVVYLEAPVDDRDLDVADVKEQAQSDDGATLPQLREPPVLEKSPID